ncbi:MAG TPA: glycosyltransferase family 2 protein, partial [Mycobacteriales bacterium]|nr:glycosyltransferase family 2 protein [Mycobacteriales bacterium]
MAPRISVVLPVYGQQAFLDRALAGLLDQDLADWELVVVDDGTPDPGAVAREVARYADPRIRVDRLPANAGLGAACNRGLDLTGAPLVTYLPADDVVYPDHLAALVEALAGGAALALTGLRHHGGAESLGPPEGFGPQLVQVAHRRTPARWTERPTWEDDDLDRL